MSVFNLFLWFSAGGGGGNDLALRHDTRASHACPYPPISSAGARRLPGPVSIGCMRSTSVSTPRHVWSLIYAVGPFPRPFGIFHGPTHITTGSKRANYTCLSISSGLGTTLGKLIFFRSGNLDGAIAGTDHVGHELPSSSTKSPLVHGLGVSLGDSEAWKPQKVGGCRWTGCPRNLHLSHIAQDTAHFWVRDRSTKTVHHPAALLAIFWPFLGHFMGLEGNKGLFGTRKSHRSRSVPTVSHRLAVLNGF